ncbi:RES family NAD+ phosphorylase [uncultured Halopseudomonas sp.]|uniref:RES family NAD+ phosphorylase n=1 Tax=uncultured Halopseudomonas sp. TaxID=2901193 RepID=UPI0030EC819C|tara:strand:- start:53083 stop:53781 length:699 start_codon:yes stop_codon:yes gene_type:complete
MVTAKDLPVLSADPVRAYRLVNSKFPPIAIFDDVASADEFEELYALQALTNPRLANQAGRLELIPRADIPFGIQGCSYAAAPFTHVNPDGSRFSDGSFGVLYLADCMETAIAEVRYHQQIYWANVPALRFERFVFRGLTARFDEAGVLDALTASRSDPIYSPTAYDASRLLGRSAFDAGSTGIRYHSVRQPGGICWGLLTPRQVSSVVQTAHYEMIWNGEVIGVHKLSTKVG